MSLTPEDKQWISELSQQDRLWMSELREQDRQWTLEQLERVETKLLTAFHHWAEPLTSFVRSHSAEIRALQIAIESIQDRVDKLEEKHP